MRYSRLVFLQGRTETLDTQLNPVITLKCNASIHGKTLEMLVTASQRARGPLESKTSKSMGLSVDQLRISLALPLVAAFSHTHHTSHSLWINTTLVVRAICAAGLTFR